MTSRSEARARAAQVKALRDAETQEVVIDKESFGSSEKRESGVGIFGLVFGFSLITIGAFVVLAALVLWISVYFSSGPLPSSGMAVIFYSPFLLGGLAISSFGVIIVMLGEINRTLKKG